MRQVQWFDFPGNLANPWVWATTYDRAGAQAFYWVGYGAAAVAALAIGAASARSIHRPKALLALATLCAFALPFLLLKITVYFIHR